MRVLILCAFLASCATVPSQNDAVYHRSASFKHDNHQTIECKTCHNLEYRVDSFFGIKLSCVNCHK